MGRLLGSQCCNQCRSCGGGDWVRGLALPLACAAVAAVLLRQETWPVAVLMCAPLPAYLCRPDGLRELAERRRSVRWFADRPVPHDLIDKALEVGLQAPSACNRQPFAFRFFDDPELVPAGRSAVGSDSDSEEEEETVRYSIEWEDGFVAGSSYLSATEVATRLLPVDRETGRTRVLRYTAVQDAGRAIHPSYVEGQMQGGAAQGIGWALNEEYIYGEDGKLQNPGFLDYRLPVASDLPMIDTVIVEVLKTYA